MTYIDHRNHVKRIQTTTEISTDSHDEIVKHFEKAGYLNRGGFTDDRARKWTRLPYGEKSVEVMGEGGAA